MLKQTNVNEKVLADVKGVVSSIISLNTPSARGYLFNINAIGDAISTGMFCDYSSEIKESEWDYFLGFKTKKIYKIIGDDNDFPDEESIKPILKEGSKLKAQEIKARLESLSQVELNELGDSLANKKYPKRKEGKKLSPLELKKMMEENSITNIMVDFDGVWDDFEGVTGVFIVTINRGNGFEESLKVVSNDGSMFYMGPFYDCQTSGVDFTKKSFMFYADDVFFTKGEQ